MVCMGEGSDSIYLLPGTRQQPGVIKSTFNLYDQRSVLILYGILRLG